MNEPTHHVAGLARRLAPEDIRRGQFVGVLSEVHQHVVLPCEPGAWLSPVRVVQVPCLDCAEGAPRRVVSVCLPFVQVESPGGDLSVLDVRRHVLAELSEEFGLEAFTRPKAPDGSGDDDG